MPKLTMPSELRKVIMKERNAMRTIASNLGDIYIKFKIECAKRRISLREGLDIAIREQLNKWHNS